MGPTILLATIGERPPADLQLALRRDFPEARVELTGGSFTFAELSAIARRDPPPQVVLVDFTKPEVGAQMLAKIRVALPRAVPWAFAEQEDVRLRAPALEAGARGLLTPPYELAPLVDSVERALRLGRLIAFVPAQGGCGASTVALHVAAAISRELPKDSRGICLTDFDFQAGSLAFRLRLRPALRITDLLAAPDTIPRVLPQAAVRWRALDILAAPETRATIAAGEATPALINALRRRYEIVVIDMPAALYASCRDALQPDVEAFLVTTPDATPLHLAERRAQELLELGLPPERIRVVYNRTRERPEADALGPSLASLEGDFCIPNSYKTLHTAMLGGDLAPADTPVGRSYLELARRVLEQAPAPVAG